MKKLSSECFDRNFSLAKDVISIYSNKMRAIALITLLILTTATLLSGCASTQVNSDTSSPIDASFFAEIPYAAETNSLVGLAIEKPEFTVSDEFIFDTTSGLTVPKEELEAILTDFDVPITMTDRVQYYVKFFTSNARPSMQAWINRSNQYMYIVKDIFSQRDVPLDLVVLAFTESGFNPTARSRAGAMGMWQFMRSTGKIYDLNSDEWVDERRDFEKASVAAAEHLQDLYENFDDWYLALAAYNAGQGRISRAAEKHNTRDFFEIATESTLKLETRDYVPKYLAQLIIYKNMIDYGFTPPSELPLLYESVEVRQQTNIYAVADMLGCSYDDIRKLNPELLTPMTPPVKSYTMRIPVDQKDKMLALMDKKTDFAKYNIYRAKAGETLARIAQRYGTTVAAIKTLNGYQYDQIYTAKVLFVPKTARVDSAADKAFAKDIAALAPKYYTVRKGDNMSIISKKHSMPLNVLVQLNPRVKPSRIYPGQVLVISRGGLGG